MAISDKKLLKILIEEGIISEDEAAACQLYQEESLKKKGKSISIDETMKKLEILPANEIDAIFSNLASLTHKASAVIPAKAKPKIAPANLNYSAEKLTPAAPRKDIFASLPREKPQEPEDVEKSEDRVAVPVKKAKTIVVDNGKKSLFIAYALFFLFGWVGAHRYYLRSYHSGIVYSVTFAGLGLGMVIDLFLLPFMVMRYNRLEQKPTSEFTEMRKYGEIDTNIMPEWSYRETTMEKLRDSLDFFVSILLLLSLPVALALFSIVSWQPLLLLSFTVLMLFFIKNDRLEQYLESHPFLDVIPFFPFLVKSIRKARGYYREIPSSFSLFYLISPLWLPVKALFKTNCRSEFYLHLGIIAAWIMGVFSISSVLYYRADYFLESNLQPSFYLQIAAWILGGMVLLSAWSTCLAALVRMESEKRNFAVKANSWWGVFVAFVAFVGLLVAPYQTSLTAYTHQHAYQRVHERLVDASFRQQLQHLLDISVRAPQQNPSRQTLRKYIRGLVSAEEAQLFNLYRDSGNNYWVTLAGRPLVGVLDGEMYTKWQQIPAERQNELKAELEQHSQQDFVQCPYAVPLLSLFYEHDEKVGLLGDLGVNSR